MVYVNPLNKVFFSVNLLCFSSNSVSRTRLHLTLFYTMNRFFVVLDYSLCALWVNRFKQVKWPNVCFLVSKLLPYNYVKPSHAFNILPMRIILQPLQSLLIMRFNRKLIKALMPRCTFLVIQWRNSGSEVLEFCWLCYKIPRRKKKWENVVFHGPVTPLNVLIKVVQLLTFGLDLSVLDRIIDRVKWCTVFCFFCF